MNSLIKQSFKDLFYPITCIISKITAPGTIFKRKEDSSYWTVAEPERFNEYKGNSNIFEIYIYQRINKNWFGKWERKSEFITLDGEDRFSQSENKFTNIKNRCS